MRALLPATGRLVLLTLLAVGLLLPLVPGIAEAEGGPADPGRVELGDLSGAEVVVEVLPLRGGFIDPPVSAQIRDVIALADDRGSDLVVLQYTSPGGVSLDLDELLDTVASSPVPVAVLVGPLGRGAEAVGAAGLLWLAASVPAIASDATVGPLAPADLSVRDQGFDERAYVSEQLAALGADPSLVDRLLDDAVDVDELEAAGLAMRRVEGLEPLLVELDGATVTAAGEQVTLRMRSDELGVRFHSLGLVRRLLHAATTAPFIYLLLVVGLGLLLFEVFQPGFGVAGLAGIITVAIGVFGLTVLPVTWWAVALVVLGLLLYALDTAVAGFGVITLAATGSFAFGSLRFYATEQLALPWWLVAGTTITALVFFVLIMTTVLRAQAGPEGTAVEDLVGRFGTVRSVLNPEGHVYLDGALWRARWTGETKRAKVGTPVRVHGVDGAVVLVEPFDPEALAANRARGADAGDE